MAAKEVIGIIIAVFLLVVPSTGRGRHLKDPKAKDVEGRLVRIETNIAWLIRIAGIQFAFLSAVAFTS